MHHEINLVLPKKLGMGITEYCEMHNIENVGEFALSCLFNGFNIEKYGLNPSDNIKRELTPSRIKTDNSNDGKDDFEKEDLGEGSRGECERTRQKESGDSKEKESEQVKEGEGALSGGKKRGIKIIKK